MLKRFLAILLCVVMITPALASCDSDDGVPEGMQSVTLDGEPFVFYVPQTWTDNRDSGISSAYFSFPKGIMATAKHFPCDGETIEAGVKAYVSKVKAQNEALLKDDAYALKNEGEDRLSGNLAHKYVYTYNYDGEENYNLTVTQYYTFYADEIVVLSLYVMTAYYEEPKEDFEKIKNNFVLVEGKPSDKVETDEHTPKGMKKISSDDLQYACYVPMEWVSNVENKMTYAYYPELGKPNVTVTCYSPDKDYAIVDFYKILKINYEDEGYKFVGEAEELTVADRKSIACTYIIEQGEGEFVERYKLKQVLIGYNGLIYSITYTAREDRFDAHLDDVDKIVESFRFR